MKKYIYILALLFTTLTFSQTKGRGDDTFSTVSVSAITDALEDAMTTGTQTNITVSYDAVSRNFDFVVSGGGLTQEEIEDALSTFIVGGTGITSTYDDGAGTLTISISDEVFTTSEKNKLAFLTATGAIDLDQIDLDVTDNNSKVSADGSIATHSDVDLTDEANGKVLKYNSSSGNWEAEDDETGGGTGNPNVRLITTLSDLQAAQAGEILDLSGTIDAGSTNITLPAGCIITDGGGSLTGTGTLTCDLTNFILCNNRTVIDLNSLTIAGTFNVDEINMRAFGLVGDGNHSAGTGTDNRQAFLEMQKIWNYSGARPYLNADGIYPFSVITSTTTDGNNIIIGKDVHITLGDNVKLMVLPNNLDQYHAIRFEDAEGSSIVGGELIGDLLNHTFDLESGGAHGFVIGNNSDHAHVGASVGYFPGDGVNSTASINFVSLNALTNSEMNQGIIDGSGSIVADTEYQYSDLLPLSAAIYDTNGYWMLGGGSFGGFSGMVTNTFYAAYYDDSGTWIENSNLVETYTRIEKKPEYDQVRIIMQNPNPSTLSLTLYSDSVSQHVKITSPEIHHNMRQGISNLAGYAKIDGVYFHHQGFNGDNTVNGSPGAHIDLEDRYEALKGVSIMNCTFELGRGGAIYLKGSEAISIHDNIFVYSGTNPYPEKQIISMGQSYNSTLYDNIIKNGTISFGRGSGGSGNTSINTEYLFEGAYSYLEGEKATNFLIKVNPADAGTGTNIIKDFKGKVNQPLGSVGLFNTYGNEQITDSYIEFTNGVEIGSGNIFSTISTSGDPTTGYIDGLELNGITVATASKASLGMDWYSQDINKLISPIPLRIQYGDQQDFEITNSDIGGWIYLRLLSWANTDTDFNKITLDNVNVVSTDANELAGASYMLRTGDVDANLEVNNSTFHINFTGTNSDKFLNVPVNGSKVFNNCVFITDQTSSSQTLDASYVFNECDFINIDFPGATINPSGGGPVDADEIDDSSTAHKFVTAADLVKLSNTDGSNSGDETGAGIDAKLTTFFNGEEWKSGAVGIVTAVSEYTTISNLPSITGSETDPYAQVTSEANDDLNGVYVISDGQWKLRYNHHNLNIPFARTGINEIDENSGTIVSGETLNNGTDGTSVNASKYISNYIPVRYGDRLVRNVNDTYKFYDRDKVELTIASGVYGGSNFGRDIAINDESIYFVRVSGNIADLGVSNQIQKQYNLVAGARPTGWSPYGVFERDNEKYVYETDGVIWKKQTNNFFDYKTAVYQEAYLSNGNLNTSAASSGFIPCKEGEVYSHNAGANQNISFWDVQGNFVSGLIAQSFQVPSGTATMNVFFPRNTPDFKTISITKNAKADGVYYIDSGTKNVQENFTNKIRVCLIADSNGTENSLYATAGGYASLMRDLLRIETFINVSESGDSFRSFSQNIDGGTFNMPVADIYLIALGTNDFGFNRPLGTLGVGTSSDDFHGSINDVISDLNTLNPNAKIVFITPMPRADVITNTQSLTLEAYVDAIIQVCQANEYEYFDLFREISLDPYNDQINDNYYYNPGGGADRLHPLNEAHDAYIKPLITPWFKNIIKSYHPN